MNEAVVYSTQTLSSFDLLSFFYFHRKNLGIQKGVQKVVQKGLQKGGPERGPEEGVQVLSTPKCVQLKFKIIYLNCGERYKVMIDHRNCAHNLSSLDKIRLEITIT